MKSAFALALLLGCLTGCLMAGDGDSGRQIVETCFSENGVAEQDIVDLKSGKTKPEEVKDNVKCSAQCILAKFGFMNSKGQLLNDKILEHFKDAPAKEQAEKALAACGSVTGDNPCDSAFQILSCLEKHVSEMMKM
ncbi:uncharacterized protein Obp56g [Drosophila montana]|uniref:uncharacterized protein Obp56g n=1 Tax=Drosophila montana TaxID=40370 RepID=UPI00313DFBE8